MLSRQKYSSAYLSDKSVYFSKMHTPTFRCRRVNNIITQQAGGWANNCATRTRTVTAVMGIKLFIDCCMLHAAAATATGVGVGNSHLMDDTINRQKEQQSLSTSSPRIKEREGKGNKQTMTTDGRLLLLRFDGGRHHRANTRSATPWSAAITAAAAAVVVLLM